MKKFVVVAYDISDNKRREEVSGILQRYGERVNLSVFECFNLDEKSFLKLEKEIQKYIDRREDKVIFYFLCKDCVSKIKRKGIKKNAQTCYFF